MTIKLAQNFYYKLRNEDEKTLFLKFNTDKDSLITNGAKLCEGEWIYIKVNNYIKHVVKPTENLEAISKKYGISREKILADNELKTDKLFIGEILKIYSN